MKNLLLRTFGLSTVVLIFLFTACKDDQKVMVKSITLNPTSLSLKAGESQTIEANVLPKDAADKALTWKSSDNNIATVSDIGVVTGKKSGQATIEAAIGDITAICKVTVYTEVSSITLNPANIMLKVDKSQKITAIILPEDAANKSLAWTSSDTSVATVDAEGTVKALAPGTTSITAKAGAITGTCTVLVKSVEHPLELFAEYNVGPESQKFATTHNAADNGFFNFADAQNVCPKGWRLPKGPELYAVVSTNIKHCVFSGQCDIADAQETITVNGQDRSFTADYYTATKNICYGLKFKDSKGDFLSAYRWSYTKDSAPYFEVRARLLKGSDAGLTVKNVASEDFWSKSNANDIIRIFPAIGYKYVNGNTGGVNTLCYYWSSQGTATKGLLMYFLAGNYGMTGDISASLLCSARCVKDE